MGSQTAVKILSQRSARARLELLERREKLPDIVAPQPDTLGQLSRRYRENSPFPHILIPDFLEVSVARSAAQEFPSYKSEGWTHYKHQNENKQGLPKRSLFPPEIGRVVDSLNSREFVSWISQLTGIPNLLPDPSLEGGGLHQSIRGGFLNVHTDFSTHHYHKNWRRRVNLILYLNPEWKTEWGGALEFWDLGMKNCVAKYPPFFNHAVIFTTDEKSLHGFPDPLSCPEGVSRKSLALYYYTQEQSASSDARSTDYRSRPNDSFRKAAMIWMDKKVIDLYSRAKARFGFSDDLASRILRMLSHQK